MCKRDRTYAKLAADVRRLASALTASGVRAGDKVAYLASNSLELLSAHFAVPLIGGVLVAVNTRLAPAEVRYICNHSRAVLLVGDAGLLAALDGIEFDSVREVVETPSQDGEYDGAPPSDPRALALAADMVIEGDSPGDIVKHHRRVQPEALRARKPGLVVVSITPFGQDGPYAGFEASNITSFAMGGIMSLTGMPQREPLVTGGSQAHYLGGLNGFGAAVTA